MAAQAAPARGDKRPPFKGVQAGHDLRPNLSQMLHRAVLSLTRPAFLPLRLLSAPDAPQIMLNSVQELEQLANQGGGRDLGPEGWTSVGKSSKTIADALRTGESRSTQAAAVERTLTLRRGLYLEELRVALGETTLLDSCSSLLRLSLTAGPFSLTGRTELLRVVGNMCFDNSECPR